MADYDAWTTGSSMKLSFHQLMKGSIGDNHHKLFKGFEWACHGRHAGVQMCSHEKRCRYCKPTEEHEEDHPLFWRGNRSIYNEDGSWK